MCTDNLTIHCIAPLTSAKLSLVKANHHSGPKGIAIPAAGIIQPLNAVREDGIAVKTRKTGRRGIIAWIPELRKAVADLKAGNAKQGLSLVCDRFEKPAKDSAFDNRWGASMPKVLEETKLTERFTEHD